MREKPLRAGVPGWYLQTKTTAKGKWQYFMISEGWWTCYRWKAQPYRTQEGAKEARDFLQIKEPAFEWRVVYKDSDAMERWQEGLRKRCGCR